MQTLRGRETGFVGDEVEDVGIPVTVKLVLDPPPPERVHAIFVLGRKASVVHGVTSLT